MQNGSHIQERMDEPIEEPARQTAGEYLRVRREEFGYDLRDVAEQLRIRHVYLVAIEEDRLDDLPGATYAVGFVRAYAEYLQLDGPAIVERFKEETEELAKAARLVFPSPQPEGKVPSGTILVLSVLLAGLVYGGWVLLSSQDRPIAELVPALPDRFMALIGQGDAVPADSGPSEAGAPTASPATQPAMTAPETPVAQAMPPEMPPVTPAPLRPVTVAAVETPAEPAAPDEPVASSAPSDEAAPAAVPERSGPLEPDSPTGTETETVEAEETAGPPPADTAAAEPETASAAGEAGPAESTAPAPVDAAAAEPAPGPDPEPVPASPDTDVAVLTDGSPDAAVPSDAGADVTALPAPPPPPAFDSGTPREYGTENTDARVVLRASDEVWVQVRDGAGNLLLTRLLRIGDTYRVPNDPGLFMRTGNAGGLDILVDGAPIPRIGSKGTVLKEVALDADMLKAGTATRQQ